MKRLAVLAACLAALVFGLLALAEGETVIKGGSGLSAPSASFAPSAGQTIPVHLVGAQANEQEATAEFPFSLYASGDAATSVALDFSAFADGDVLIQYSSQGDPNASGWKVADLSDGGKAVCLPAGIRCIIITEGKETDGRLLWRGLFEPQGKTNAPGTLAFVLEGETAVNIAISSVTGDALLVQCTGIASPEEYTVRFAFRQGEREVLSAEVGLESAFSFADAYSVRYARQNQPFPEEEWDTLEVALCYHGIVADSDVRIVSFATSTPVATPTPTLAPTPVATPTSTLTPTPVATPTTTLVPTPVATPTPTLASTPVATPTPTLAPTPVATPTPTLAPTPVATPTPTPAPTPSPVVQICVEDYVAEYSGGVHVLPEPMYRIHSLWQVGESFALLPFGREEERETMGDVRWYYREIDAAGENPQEPIVWQQGLPRMTDVGEKVFYIRAEKEGYRFGYCNLTNGSQGGEYAIVRMKITPAPVSVRLSVEQDAEYVYDGTEQSLGYTCKAVSIEAQTQAQQDAALAKLNGSATWKNGVSGRVQGAEAGDYSIGARKAELEEMLRMDMGGNFLLSVEWARDTVSIGKREIALVSASKAMVYDEQRMPLEADPTEFGCLPENGLVSGDYYSGNITVSASQNEAGIGENAFAAFEGAFAAQQDNYAISLQPGKLIVFPQAIAPSEDAPDWETVRAKYEGNFNVEEAVLAFEQGASFYNGMAVELSVGAQIAAEEDEAVQVTYNAESYADAVGIRFRDREGNPLPLEEGTDYSLRFYRDGAETDNLTDAGEIVVVIEGVGNYAGIAQRKLMILPRAVVARVDMVNKTAVLEDVSPALAASFDAGAVVYGAKGPEYFDPNLMVTFVAETAEEAWLHIESWTYDAQGANAHIASGYGTIPGVYAYYDSEGNAIDAPADVGSYRVTATWAEWSPAQEVRLEAEFEILPRQVIVTAADVEMTYGDEVPTHLSWTAEGLVAGTEAEEAIRVAPALEKTADGTYSIGFPAQEGDALVNSAEQGNYAIEYRPGKVTILPRDIGLGEIAREGNGFAVRDDLGNLLAEGKDYILAQEEMDDGDLVVSVEGQGNYTGELTNAYAAIPLEILAVSFTDAAGAPLERINVSLSGKIGFSGTVETNAPVETADLRVFVNGTDAGAEVTAVSEERYAFAVEDFALAEKREQVDVQVVCENVEAEKVAIPLAWMALAMVWLGLAIACALLAVGSALLSCRLRKRIRREQFRLLDKVSRKSNRTIGGAE